jgi:hypothetical protein
MRVPNHCSVYTVLLLVCCSIQCAYKNRNQNSSKTARRYVAGLFKLVCQSSRWQQMSKYRIQTNIATLTSDRFHFPYFRHLCHKVSNISFRYQLCKMFSHKHNIVTRGLSLFKSPIKNISFICDKSVTTQKFGIFELLV